MTDGFYIPDGNEALRDDIPAVVELIERTARWVNPETFYPKEEVLSVLEFWGIELG